MRNFALILFLAALALSGCNAKEKAEEEAGPLSQNYHVVAVAHGGTIHGKVTIENAAVAMRIEIQKDQDACHDSHTNPSAPVNQGVASGTIVYLERVDSGKAWVTQTAMLEQKGCEYLPHVQVLQRGSTMRLTNGDDALHNSNFKLNGITEFNPAQPKGAPPQEIKLTKDGLYTVNCDVHPWMRGFVQVMDHPYFAVVDANGSYTIANIPPGNYTLKLWRDNWQIDQPKDASGHITTYNWGSDFRKQQPVTVAASTSQEINFSLP